MRGQEIFVRLDQHCSALLDLTLLSDPLPILPASLKGSLPISNEIYKLPIMTAFATELATCLHPSVYISSCSSKFLLLLSRICLRLEGLIAILLRSPTSCFPADMLQTLLAQEEGHLHGGIKLRLTVRELIILVRDFSTMLSWLMRDLCATAEACMIDERETKIVITGEADHGDDVTPVRKCFSLLHLRLTGVRGLVWKEVRHLLLLDCRDVLLLPVKSVASRFRMTNKPPPNAPSPYVENILNPLRYAA